MTTLKTSFTALFTLAMSSTAVAQDAGAPSTSTTTTTATQTTTTTTTVAVRPELHSPTLPNPAPVPPPAGQGIYELKTPIMTGMTVGFGMVAHLPVWPADKLEQFGVGGMPYVAFFPWYKRYAEETRHYCAVLWETGDAKKAQSSADALALKNNSTTWSLGSSSKCWVRQLNWWIGKPFNYEATTTLGDNSQVFTTIRPLFATGLGISPVQNLNFIAGVSLSHFEKTQASGKPVTTARDWAFLVGVGAHLDILSKVFK